MGQVGVAGQRLKQFIDIWSVPLTCTVATSLMMNFTCPVYLLLPIPVQIKIFYVTWLLSGYLIFYWLSSVAQHTLDLFNRLHWRLLDRSLETVSNRYSRWQKHQPAVTVADAVRVYEFYTAYRRYFKIFYLHGLMPLNLNSFGHIILFLLNYMILLIQTSID